MKCMMMMIIEPRVRWDNDYVVVTATGFGWMMLLEVSLPHFPFSTIPFEFIQFRYHKTHQNINTEIELN